MIMDDNSLAINHLVNAITISHNILLNILGMMKILWEGHVFGHLVKIAREGHNTEIL